MHYLLSNVLGGDKEISHLDGSAMEAEEPFAREYPSDFLTQQNGVSGLRAHIFPSLMVHRIPPPVPGTLLKLCADGGWERLHCHGLIIKAMEV